MRLIRFFAAVLTVSTVIMLGPWQAGAELSATRTAPYDFGCLRYASDCHAEFEPARDGVLHSSTAATPCLYYWVPFVWPCLSSAGTATGIYVDVAKTAEITVSSVVRGTSPADLPSPLGLRAHFHLAYPSGGGYAGYGSAPVVSGKATVITTNFENAKIPPGRYKLYVSLGGGPGGAVVESISYELAVETTPSPSPSPSTSPSAPPVTGTASPSD